jgi:hypothetical protein
MCCSVVISIWSSFAGTAFPLLICYVSNIVGYTMLKYVAAVLGKLIKMFLKEFYIRTFKLLIEIILHGSV